MSHWVSIPPQAIDNTLRRVLAPPSGTTSSQLVFYSIHNMQKFQQTSVFKLVGGCKQEAKIDVFRTSAVFGNQSCGALKV